MKVQTAAQRRTDRGCDGHTPDTFFLAAWPWRWAKGRKLKPTEGVTEFSAGPSAKRCSEGKNGPRASRAFHLLLNKPGSSLRVSLEARVAHSRWHAFTQAKAETSVTRVRSSSPVGASPSTSPTVTTQGQGRTQPLGQKHLQGFPWADLPTCKSGKSYINI